MSGMLSSLIFFACIVLILGIVTLGLNLQWGFTGIFNAGVVGFYAIGGYTQAILTAAPTPGHLGNLGWPWAVGIVAAMAIDPSEDADLVSFDASHLFPRHLTWAGFRRGSFLRRYTLDFIQGLAPHLERSQIQKAERTADQAGVDALFEGAPLPIYA